MSSDSIEAEEFKSCFSSPDTYFPALIELAKALRVSADELLGLKSARTDDRAEDPEMCRLWKKFQLVASLPDKDQRAVIRLINSLARSDEG